MIGFIRLYWHIERKQTHRQTVNEALRIYIYIYIYIYIINNEVFGHTESVSITLGNIYCIKNLYEIQLEWALRATEVAPLDYRTFGHVADAYLNLENILDAEKTFNPRLS